MRLHCCRHLEQRANECVALSIAFSCCTNENNNKNNKKNNNKTGRTKQISGKPTKCNWEKKHKFIGSSECILAPVAVDVSTFVYAFLFTLSVPAPSVFFSIKKKTLEQNYIVLMSVAVHVYKLPKDCLLRLTIVLKPSNSFSFRLIRCRV